MLNSHLIEFENVRIKRSQDRHMNNQTNVPGPDRMTRNHIGEYSPDGTQTLASKKSFSAFAMIFTVVEVYSSLAVLCCL